MGVSCIFSCHLAYVLFLHLEGSKMDRKSKYAFYQYILCFKDITFFICWIMMPADLKNWDL